MFLTYSDIDLFEPEKKVGNRFGSMAANHIHIWTEQYAEKALSHLPPESM